jgi:hypothetical protein
MGTRRYAPISALAHPNAASQRGLRAAMAELYGVASVPPDDALAEQERFRREDEARRSAQGCLRLEPAQ